MHRELLSGKRVLVVEDEMLVAMQTEDMLSDLGCTSISIVGDIEPALECISSEDFDFATLDINLAGRKSYMVADALQERQIPFAFATGYGPSGVDEGYRHVPVLAKPYTCRELQDVVERLLADGC